MPVSLAGFGNALAGPPKSVQDYMAEYDQQDARKLQMQHNALSLQQQQGAMADQDRARQEAVILRNALSGLGAGATDEQRIQALKGTGLPGGFSQADALEKSILDRQKTGAVIGKDNAETATKQYALTRQKLEHGVMGLQVAQSPAQAAAMFQDGVQKGYWSMQDAQRQMQTIPQDPAQFMTWRQQQLAQILDAEKQLPKLIDTDQGGTRLFGARDPITGALRVNSSQPITQSANNAAQVGATIRGQDVSAATTRRGQDMTDSRARDTLAHQVEKDKGGGNTTEGERNAAGYLLRMQKAMPLLDKYEASGKPGYASNIAGGLPVVGNSARTAVMSQDQQLYRQAQEDWVRAKLRKESGAAIGVDEMDREILAYFPQPGEGKAVAQQKRAARETAVEAMKLGAGRASGAAGAAAVKPEGTWDKPAGGVINWSDLPGK